MTRRAFLIMTLLTGACQAPDIDDWPPTPPPVSEAEIQFYVDRYSGAGGTPPEYTADDLDALILLNNRRSRPDEDADDLTRFRRDLLDNLAKGEKEEKTAPSKYSRNDINALERRLRWRYNDDAYKARRVLRRLLRLD